MGDAKINCVIGAREARGRAYPSSVRDVACGVVAALRARRRIVPCFDIGQEIDKMAKAPVDSNTDPILIYKKTGPAGNI
jgi:hypothetical protein